MEEDDRKKSLRMISFAKYERINFFFYEVILRRVTGVFVHPTQFKIPISH